ncbi:MAG: hypothetical protein AVDCRST_MAG03-3008 [uncultured Rubrobacteraceae bacterium]|uniref:Uncharacterized protein n=1 Tax=uncultured Rubrobacteraceae bacterium TaxID=349277 RepID=A0A6J4Q450_9ACTN|nr:MAG: hypothetical protein AVDCRST_MAG03-3008 [uncultured Rubrobacteraceae bacterium]
MAGRLGGRLARFLSEKLDDPRSREAARKALRRVTGEEPGRRTTEGEGAAQGETHGDYIAGFGAIEVGDRAGFELRDRVAEALKLYPHNAELLGGALRQALAHYDRRTLGDPEGRSPT